MDKEYIRSRGQYFTKNKELQECVFNFIRNQPDIILEPSIGRGDLVRCVSEKMKDVRFHMCEIDEKIELLDCIDRSQVVYSDFIKVELDRKYGTIIGNPPYIKKREGNLYLEFIAKCFDVLRDGGELIFIVPTDFFQLTSASKLLKEMISQGHFTDVYHPNNEGLFEDASIDVMVFRYCREVSDTKITMFNNEPKYLVESNGLITFSETVIDVKETLSDYFEISVGLVSACESVYRNKELGNLDILTDKETYTKYIYIDEFPCEDKKINEYLLSHKEKLIQRRIKKYTEKNWFEWGAPRNIKKMKKYKGEECIYVSPLTRDKKVAFIGKVDYFGGLIMMRPHKKCDLEKVIKYLNSEKFKSNYMYSGRFKIGQRQLVNSYITL
jgi:adenine-specific DNA-methyltransferase